MGSWVFFVGCLLEGGRGGGTKKKVKRDEQMFKLIWMFQKIRGLGKKGENIYLQNFFLHCFKKNVFSCAHRTGATGELGAVARWYSNILVEESYVVSHCS